MTNRRGRRARHKRHKARTEVSHRIRDFFMWHRVWEHETMYCKTDFDGFVGLSAFDGATGTAYRVDGPDCFWASDRAKKVTT